MVGYDLNNAGVMTGDKQIDSLTRPVRWTAEGGVEELALGESGETGYSYDINELGDSVGQINREDGSAVPALWRADGTLVELGLPDWLPYDYARAFAMNDDGAVVGNASLLRQEDDGKWHEYNDPFIWTEADGFQRLPHIGDDRHMTEPFAINNDGYVVGHSDDRRRGPPGDVVAGRDDRGPGQPARSVRAASPRRSTTRESSSGSTGTTRSCGPAPTGCAGWPTSASTATRPR